MNQHVLKQLIVSVLFFGIIFALYILLLLSCSVTSDSLQPHGLQHTRLPCPSLSHKSLLKLMSLELVISSNHLILCHPLLFSPSLFPSVRIFSSERVSSLHQVAKVLEFQL